MTRKIESKAGSAAILWTLATSPFPLTVRRTTQRLNLDHTKITHRDTVASTLRRLYETGMVQRRKVPGVGGPYEYTLNPDWVPNQEDGDGD